MKYFFVILLILQSFLSLSQQTIELCDGVRRTYSYFTSSNNLGTNEWELNGTYYNTDTLTITWETVGTYNIYVIRYSDGCPSDPETFTVYVKPCSNLIFWVPNTFTPNGDEYNTLWGPVFSNYDDIDLFNLVVFNRWGNLIWESNNPAGRWDGTYDLKPCLDGIYTWKIVFSTKNTDEIKEFHGFITLIK